MIMTVDLKNVRIDGIYPQRQDGYFMQRVKLPAGVLSAAQANCIADTADRFGQGLIHLTSRGSMEIHWIKGGDLQLVKQELAKSGLTSRGACGGAVRGVTCSSQDAAEFPQLESMARRLHRHFTGNPRFERLPKKFKIGIEADTTSGRHLIQDVGLVFAGADSIGIRYNVWIAGGLGREPRAGFLLLEGVSEGRIVPVIEAVIAVYARLAPPPKRLKFLASEMGEEELCRLIKAEPSFSEELPHAIGLSDNLTMGGERLVIPVFAGQLTADELRGLAAFAGRNSNGVLQVTADQDMGFILSPAADRENAANELHSLADSSVAEPVTFRICPGSHECKMGLAATRDLAKALIAVMPEKSRGLVWALSGCPNSCVQPQLADVGIVSSRLVTNEQGGKAPLFDLYRRHCAGLGEKLQSQLTIDELTDAVRGIAA
jgi:ferredoxin-nitrite reductase